MLAIFALSNTPTTFLHKIFANHTDFVSVSTTDSHQTQISVTGINCHCNNLVVISPYTTETSVLSATITSKFQEFNIADISAIPVSQPFFFKLRGPPFNIC